MTIPIQNIYFLLCYAWDSLEEGQVVSVSQEECNTFAELFARVLDGGVTHLLKRGLDRGYITEEEDTSSLRGKLDVSVTIKRNLLRQSRVHCVIDSLSHDVTHNRIIKATLRSLVRCKDLDRTLRDRLLRLYRRLHEIGDIDLSPKVFASVQLHRNNAYYGFLLQVCRLIHDNLLINEDTGESRFRDFLRNEKQMAALFEKFVRNFYRREQGEFRVKSETFGWQQVEASHDDLEFLPRMRTDVSLDSPSRKIVIDTKYYANCLQSYYDSATVHSGNLYQLFAYLKNLQIGDHREIEGVLLYPTVSKSLSLRYSIQGHAMRIVTLDLNATWQEIRQRLLQLLVPSESNAVEVSAELA
jgi:5-methylcytosine-specific restriction enzyme subunit McrC